MASGNEYNFTKPSSDPVAKRSVIPPFPESFVLLSSPGFSRLFFLVVVVVVVGTTPTEIRFAARHVIASSWSLISVSASLNELSDVLTQAKQSAPPVKRCTTVVV